MGCGEGAPPTEDVVRVSPLGSVTVVVVVPDA